MPWVRSLLAAVAVVLALLVPAARAADPPIPVATGFVTDTARVLSAPVQTRIVRLVTELQQKTGAEIAVLTVLTTAPLDDFNYAVRVADAWRPGRKKDDSGVLLLVATQDRKIRILTGYGVEGILPDGLIGEIEDREMLPLFRAGQIDEGIFRGVAAVASRIAASHGVTLTGVPAPRAVQQPPQLPWWVVLLIVVVILIILSNSNGPTRGFGGRGGGPIFIPGPMRFPGGWSDGGGGFGGFGGGGFGGGGAGRSW